MAPLWPVAVPPESMVLDVRAARNQLVEQLRKAPKASDPANLQSYVGSPVPVLGLSVPTMRAIVAAFAKDHPTLDAAAVNALASALWSGVIFEEKSLGILLLGRYEKILDDDSWKLAARWVDTATGWGLSDGLASGPIAGMVHAKGSRFRDILRWTRAKNIWRRRASTYALHRFVRMANSIGRSGFWSNFCTIRNSGSNARLVHGSGSAGRKIEVAPRPSCGSTHAACHGS